MGIRLLFCLLLGLLASFSISERAIDGKDKSVPKKEQGPYNFILISIDTLRPDFLTCYGNKNGYDKKIHEFARECVVFKNAYAQSPWTTPSHATLFTSLYPTVLKIEGWPNPGKIRRPQKAAHRRWRSSNTDDSCRRWRPR